jgi:hypothetical protein
MGVRVAIAAALSAGCFGPTYPEGLACSELQNCPPGQICDLDVLRCVAEPGPDAPEQLQLASVFPQATGWLDENGAPVELTFVPVDGGRYECRTAPRGEVNEVDFAACDGAEEGNYETQARVLVGEKTSPLLIYPFYAHRSLDLVATCPSDRADQDIFAAAREVLDPTGAFAADAVLVNPSIEIPFEEVIVTDAMRGGSPALWDGVVDFRLELSSLRRRFTFDAERELLLVRRQFESRRARDMQGAHSCRNGFEFGGSKGAHPRGRIDCDNLVLNRRGQSVCLVSGGPDLVLGPTSDIGWVKLMKQRRAFSPKGTVPCAGCESYLFLPE